MPWVNSNVVDIVPTVYAGFLTIDINIASNKELRKYRVYITLYDCLHYINTHKWVVTYLILHYYVVRYALHDQYKTG